jgi:malate synthase
LEIGGLEIAGPVPPRYAEILTPAACAFVAELRTKFGPRRAQLLAKRIERQAEIDAGKMPDFLIETGLDATVPVRRGAAKLTVFDCIETFYNPTRCLSSLGC